MFQDVMIDLETLGKRAGCAILSIGAVAFNVEELGPELYVVVNRQSCKENNLHEDESTLKWWESQSEEARKVLIEASSEDRSLHLHHALDSLTVYLNQFPRKSVRIWGNGSDFDTPILVAAYAAAGQDPPWNFWNSRCYRTLKGMDGTKPSARAGTYHNALDDAKTQALHLQEIIKRREWPLA